MQNNKDILEEVRKRIVESTTSVFNEATRIGVDKYNERCIKSSLEKIFRKSGIPENRVGIEVEFKDNIANVSFKDMRSGKLIAIDEVNELLMKYGEVELVNNNIQEEKNND